MSLFGCSIIITDQVCFGRGEGRRTFSCPGDPHRQNKSGAWKLGLIIGSLLLSRGVEYLGS